jgi:hypothetical protein
MFYKFMEKKKNKNISVLPFLVLFIFFLKTPAVFSAETAKLYFGTPSTAITPASNFRIAVLLDTNVPINAVDLEVKYPQDKLKFLGSDNTHSIIDIWQTPPQMLPDNNIHITGGVLKSFSGTKGLVVELSFKALSAGKIEFSFEKTNVYIADGKGTKANTIVETSAVNITGNAGKNEAPVAPVTQTNPSFIDSTPPQISLGLVKSPADDSTLIAFQINDPESGIKENQMRIKKWFTYSPWQDVQNPVLYPAGAWSIELRSINNAGVYGVKSLIFKSELFKKLLLLPVILLILFFGLYLALRNKATKEYNRGN